MENRSSGKVDQLYLKSKKLIPAVVSKDLQWFIAAPS
jgi:hypothetical protein